MNRLCEPWIVGSADIDMDTREKLWQYFGTFTRSMLTMFALAFGEWFAITLLLVDKITSWAWVPFLVHQFVIGFAVFAVVQGVFINETFHAAETDNEIMVRRQERETQQHIDKMRYLFSKADRDEGGTLSVHEFRAVMKHDDVKAWMESMGLELEDLDKVWRLIADGNGELTCDQLTDGVAKVKGEAKSIDVLSVVQDLDYIVTHVREITRAVNELREHGHHAPHHRHGNHIDEHGIHTTAKGDDLNFRM